MAPSFGISQLDPLFEEVGSPHPIVWSLNWFERLQLRLHWTPRRVRRELETERQIIQNVRQFTKVLLSTYSPYSRVTLDWEANLVHVTTNKSHDREIELPLSLFDTSDLGDRESAARVYAGFD